MGHAPGHHLGQQEVRRVMMMMIVTVILRYGGPDIYVTENGCSSKISNLDDLSR